MIRCTKCGSTFREGVSKIELKLEANISFSPRGRVALRNFYFDASGFDEYSINCRCPECNAQGTVKELFSHVVTCSNCSKQFEQEYHFCAFNGYNLCRDCWQSRNLGSTMCDNIGCPRINTCPLYGLLENSPPQQDNNQQQDDDQNDMTGTFRFNQEGI